MPNSGKRIQTQLDKVTHGCASGFHGSDEPDSSGSSEGHIGQHFEGWQWRGYDSRERASACLPETALAIVRARAKACLREAR